VGTLVTGVKTALQNGYKWAVQQQVTSFKVACAKPGAAITCKFDETKQKLLENTIAVTIAPGATPSVAEPFNTVSGCVMVA
jgi:hypothetical protein